jgi:hypothetical protein
MINPQKGIDLMNNNSIINRILFAVPIFQHPPPPPPLNKKGFLQHHQERERETTSTTSGTLIGISINHRKFFSSSFTTWSRSSIIIICINMV